MNLQIKKLWIDALRSGKYVQGKRELKTSRNEYCCLGVLCDIYSTVNEDAKWVDTIDATGSSINEFRININNDKGYNDKGSCHLLPSEVWQWAELPGHNPSVGLHSLSALNDSGKSFEEIANLIEEKL